MSTEINLSTSKMQHKVENACIGCGLLKKSNFLLTIFTMSFEIKETFNSNKLDQTEKKYNPKFQCQKLIEFKDDTSYNEHLWTRYCTVGCHVDIA